MENFFKRFFVLSEYFLKANYNIFHLIDVALQSIDGLEDCTDDKTSLAPLVD